MFAYKMWSEEGYEYPKGYTFADIMKLDPQVTWSDMQLSKSIVSLEEKTVELKFDINFSWHNFNRKKWIDWLISRSAYRTIKSFKYSTWVSINGKKTIIANEKVLDVSKVSMPAPEAGNGEEYITISSSTYSDSMIIDLTTYTGSRLPIDYIEFHIKPYILEEGGDGNEEEEKYKETQVYKIEYNQSGQKLEIVRVNTSYPIINAENHINPMYDASGTGSPRYLIYNHPNARVAVSLSSLNSPISRNGKVLYTANIASIGAASSPVPSSMKVGSLNSTTWCCTSDCMYDYDSHIQLIKDNSKHFSFLSNKYPNRNFCKIKNPAHIDFVIVIDICVVCNQINIVSLIFIVTAHFQTC